MKHAHPQSTADSPGYEYTVRYRLSTSTQQISPTLFLYRKLMQFSATLMLVQTLPVFVSLLASEITPPASTVI